MIGMVAYHDDLKRIRPMYVDVRLAQKYKVKSTVLLLETTKSQGALFVQYWKNLHLNPGRFNIVGRNCSTHASNAFVAAKIVTSGIPGLDTPNGLYKQLKAKYSGRMRVYSGYIGANHNGGDKYALVVE